MKYTKLSAAAALAAGSALILSACAPGGGNAGDSSSNSASGASQGGDSGAGNVIEGDKGQKLTAEASGPGKAELYVVYVFDCRPL